MNGHLEDSDGERGQLLPMILDRRAQSEPDRVWAKFPVSPTSYSQGFRAATYGQMRNAVNRVAWMLAETIGTSTQFDTLAYLGPNDLRYHIMVLAAIKIGYKAFLPSPRNSTVAQKDLLTRLECRVLATTDPEPPFVSSILRDYHVQTVVRIPPLEALLHESDHASLYPYDKSFDVARHDPVLVLHTSGSTGIPKPMIYTNEFVWRIYKANTLPAPPGTTRVDDYFLRGEFFSFLPAFHIAGIGWGLILPMFASSIPVLPLPGRPPSTDAFLEALKYGRFDWAFLLPVIIDEVSKDAEALKLVASRLKYLFYTGGALPRAAGEVVSSKIPVFSGLGSSECSALPQLRADDASSTDTWQYVHIHPETGSEFRHYMDDLHELVIVKSTEQSEAQPVFAMFPHLHEYETRDLFSPHPSIPNLWRHRGRRDDIVVFLNGEKTNPISFEQEVSRHAAVQAALVAGNQRFEACLLIEPASVTGTLSDSAKAALVKSIWPAVEEANRRCPAHARISKSKVLILDPDRPMLRAGKGTVQREGTLRLYAPQIDALYSDAEGQGHGQQTDGNDATPPISSLEDTAKTLRSLVADVTSWSEFDNDTDFFSAGMDSLQALRLSAAIRSRFNIPSISPAVIYKNPSVDLLAKQICRPSQHTTTRDAEDDRTTAMASLLRQYEQNIDQVAVQSPEPPSFTRENIPTPEVVLLTGSTGTVGSFFLNRLLADSRVSHIYCLNRAPDSRSLQCARNRHRGLACDFPPDRVTFLTADLARDHLGLDDDTDTYYTTLLNRTTQIIHAAWPVDFNQPLRFFQPSLDGLIGLISFAHHARLRPSLLFLSSISAVSAYNISPLIPEAPIPTNLPCPAARMGYGESKYAAEQVLAYAAARGLGPCLGVARIGQVAGASSTARGWNRAEWLPSLILSSRRLRALPGSIGMGGGVMASVDWVPVDDLASVLVELSFSLAKSKSSPASGGGGSGGGGGTDGGDDGNLQVFHCVNPHPIPWRDLVPVIVRVLSGSLGSGSGDTDKRGKDEDGDVISVIGFREWLDRLESSATSTIGGAGSIDQGERSASLATDLERNPALKLLDFYHQLIIDSAEDGPSARLSSEKTVHLSKSLAKLGPIQPEWVSGWIQDWLRH
ncbi:Male sterility, NAD-binding [Madurella fahalii]|uniref:Male sterility, NAD-binding n=1 Tax=Madurella fahalii TaxID=1157608 RepID=A0ABQ0G3N3_9PEZI